MLTFPNVLITGHQGFFSKEALKNIAETTLHNISAFESGAGTLHRGTAEARLATRVARALALVRP